MVIDSFPSQSSFAASMGHESGGTSQPDFFLKPVAGSAARLAPRLHWAVSSKLALEMAIYSLTGNARSPFHAEPAQSLKLTVTLPGAKHCRKSPWRRLAKKGHEIWWEFNKRGSRRHTRRLLIDGNPYTVSEAKRRSASLIPLMPLGSTVPVHNGPLSLAIVLGCCTDPTTDFIT